jgi:tricorn protease-like protein
MSGLIIDKEDLEFTESIEFFNDSTFVKQRIYPDSSSNAYGKYNSLFSRGNDFLVLNYKRDTYLIQTCGNSLVEYLSIQSETEIYNGGYLPCDGPGYYYTRVKK